MTMKKTNGIKLKLFLSILILLILITPVHSDQQNNRLEELPTLTYEEPERETGDFAVQLIKVVFGLIVVLALLFALLKFIKKSQSKFADGGTKVVDFTSLGANRGIAVVKVGDKVLVLGVTDSNITKITELNEEELNHYNLDLDESVDMDMGMPFHQQLKRNISRLNSNLSKKGGSDEQ